MSNGLIMNHSIISSDETHLVAYTGNTLPRTQNGSANSGMVVQHVQTPVVWKTEALVKMCFFSAFS